MSTHASIVYEDHSGVLLASHSKNGGMIFIPIEYDIHTNKFHTYGNAFPGLYKKLELGTD